MNVAVLSSRASLSDSQASDRRRSCSPLAWDTPPRLWPGTSLPPQLHGSCPRCPCSHVRHATLNQHQFHDAFSHHSMIHHSQFREQSPLFCNFVLLSDSFRSCTPPPLIRYLLYFLTSFLISFHCHETLKRNPASETVAGLPFQSLECNDTNGKQTLHIFLYLSSDHLFEFPQVGKRRQPIPFFYCLIE